jgi:hypothetical protein
MPRVVNSITRTEAVLLYLGIIKPDRNETGAGLCTNMPERFKRNAPLNEPDSSTFYVPGAWLDGLSDTGITRGDNLRRDQLVKIGL